MLKVKRVLTDYAIEFEDITHINDKLAIDINNSKGDGWMQLWKEYLSTIKNPLSMGCTAVMKEIDGQMLMSRNMDYIVSDKTECVFKVNAPQRYKSINVTNYSAYGSKNFHEIIKNGGISDEEADFISYFVTDGINEKGLVVEFNMRPTEYEDDKKTYRMLSVGTNPGKIRVPISTLTRLALDQCANVKELLSFVGAIDGSTGEKYGDGEYDFYTVLSEEMNWILCFSIMDADGNYGVLEPINNKLIWTNKAKGQANFFVDKQAESEEVYGSGYGRWKYLMDRYDDIKSAEEFFNITKDISYKKAELNIANWDVSTESTHMDVFGSVETMMDFAKNNGIKIPDTSKLKQTIILEDGSKKVLDIKNYKDYEPHIRAAGWTKDFVEKDPTGEVKEKIKWSAKLYASLTDQQVRDASIYWNTAHHELFNATDKTLKVEFWEDGKVFDFSLE